MPLEKARCSGSPDRSNRNRPASAYAAGSRLAAASSTATTVARGSRCPSSSTSSRANRTVSWTGGSNRSGDEVAAGADPVVVGVDVGARRTAQDAGEGVNRSQGVDYQPVDPEGDAGAHPPGPAVQHRGRRAGSRRHVETLTRAS